MDLTVVRRRLEESEERLSPFAARSRLSRGRQRPEEPSPVRTEFQRDRDRIVHSKAFRRLKDKTQVFVAPLGDHYATRLNHTLEVAQIARTISRALNLNEDLAEAIALGHDLGHPPFGHAGEEVLASLVPEGFRHNEQTLRVVDLLERGGRGLNLTWEVRDGLLKHSKLREGIQAEGIGLASTLEGQVCRLADVIAYINHDLADALRAGLVAESDLPSKAIARLGSSHAERINTLVCDVISCSWPASGQSDTPPQIGMSPQVLAAADALRDFLFRRVYTVSPARADLEKVRRLLATLYEHFTSHPDQLPPEYLARGEPVERVAVDHIASMTDRYALRTFEELYVPQLWSAS